MSFTMTVPVAKTCPSNTHTKLSYIINIHGQDVANDVIKLSKRHPCWKDVEKIIVFDSNFAKMNRS